MVANLFEGLLQDLGKILGTPLSPDSNNSCLLKLKNGVQIQIEIDRNNEELIIGSDLGTVPPGRYRINILREALRSNALTHRHGVLAFSPKANSLVLFLKLPALSLNAEQISFQLGPFSEKALVWHSALTHGEVPVVTAPPDASTNIFGLKR